jgi:hypothetical protein
VPKAPCRRLAPATGWCRRRIIGCSSINLRELQGLRGKKTPQNEILREALALAQPKKPAVALAVVRLGRYAMKTVADTLDVARSNLAAQVAIIASRQRRGRRPQPDAVLLAEITAIIARQLKVLTLPPDVSSVLGRVGCTERSRP